MVQRSYPQNDHRCRQGPGGVKQMKHPKPVGRLQSREN